MGRGSKMFTTEFFLGFVRLPKKILVFALGVGGGLTFSLLSITATASEQPQQQQPHRAAVRLLTGPLGSCQWTNVWQGGKKCH